MKNVLVILLVAAGFLGSCAQQVSQGSVPSVVLNTFLTSYPKATDVEWKLKGTVYHVEFEIGKTDHEAWYDASAKLLKHKEEIKIAELPAAVFNTVKQDVPGYQPDDADKIEEGGKVFYVIELDGAPNDRILHVTPEGKVLENRVDY